MKVIRALRDIFVPHDPEKPDTNAMKVVRKGLLTLIPDDFKLPEDAFEDVGRFDVNKKKGKKDS